MVVACGVEPEGNGDRGLAEADRIGNEETVSADGLRHILQCVEDPNVHVDWIPMPIALAEVARWLKIESVTTPEIRRVDGRTLLEVRAVTARDGVAQDTAIHVWPPAVAPVEAALRVPGVEVYVGLGSAADEEPDLLDAMVIFALDHEGFSFLGECDAIRSNREVDEEYGGAAVEVLRSAVWALGSDLVKATRQDLTPPGPEQPDQVVPGFTTDDPKLVTWTIELDWPPVGTDEFTWCLRAGDTWGTCASFGLLGEEGGAYPFVIGLQPGYVGDLEVWVLDGGADPDNPLMLAAVVPTSEVDASRTAAVSVDLLEVAPLSVSASRTG